MEFEVRHDIQKLIDLREVFILAGDWAEVSRIQYQIETLAHAVNDDCIVGAWLVVQVFYYMKSRVDLLVDLIDEGVLCSDLLDSLLF